MTSTMAPKRSTQLPKRRWARSCLKIFGIGFAAVVVIVVVWSLSQSITVVGDATAHFASMMRVVRPLILLTIIAAWQPAFWWLESRALVRPETARRAIGLWPRITIWVALLELTVGQGFVLVGIASIAIYWFLVRRIVEL